MKLKIPFYKQDTDHTCGPASLQMALSFLGDFKSEKKLSEEAHTNHDVGTKHNAMIETARKEGFYCYVNNDSSLNEISNFLAEGLPVIIHFAEPQAEEEHYAVVVGFEKGEIILNDPWNGKNFKMGKKDFLSRWHGAQGNHQYIKWAMVISDEDFKLGKQYSPIAKENK
ncbi:MAG: peptidase C39 family protein [Patescibacteria group bacterium]